MLKPKLIQVELIELINHIVKYKEQRLPSGTEFCRLSLKRNSHTSLFIANMSECNTTLKYRRVTQQSCTA